MSPEIDLWRGGLGGETTPDDLGVLCQSSWITFELLIGKSYCLPNLLPPGYPYTLNLPAATVPVRHSTVISYGHLGTWIKSLWSNESRRGRMEGDIGPPEAPGGLLFSLLSFTPGSCHLDPGFTFCRLLLLCVLGRPLTGRRIQAEFQLWVGSGTTGECERHSKHGRRRRGQERIWAGGVDPLSHNPAADRPPVEGH